VQEVEDISAALQLAVNEMYVAPSSCHDLCDFHQTPDTPASTPEEQLVSRILDADGEYTYRKKGKTPVGPPQTLPFLFLCCLYCGNLSLLQALQNDLSLFQALGLPSCTDFRTVSFHPF
jgi:hypothetical protein